MRRCHARFTTRFALLALLALTLADSQSSAYAQSSFKIVGLIWEDLNCDGMRQDGEPLLPRVRLTLRYAGENGIIDGDDPDIQYSESLTGNYGFSMTRAGLANFLSIRGEHKPAGYVPAPFRVGDDPTRDNDMTVGLLPGTPLWATPVFIMPEVFPLTGIDIGLCKLPTVYLPLVVR
jgi:hypothetical protein